MSNSRRLQDTIQSAICKQLPPLRKTRERNMARLCAALYQAEHVHLPKVADHCPGPAHQTSKTRRLRRFLSNEAVDPNAWYRPVAESLIQAAAAAGPVRVLIDTVHLTGGRRLLVAAVAFRRRALPILWRVDAASGVTGQDLQRDFVQALQPLVPGEADVVVIGDGEFHCVSLLKAVQAAGWTYCLRLHADTYVREAPGRSPQTSASETASETAPDTWTYARDLDPEPGETRVVQPVHVTKEHAFGPARVLYHPVCCTTGPEGRSARGASSPMRRWGTRRFSPPTRSSSTTGGGCGLRSFLATARAGGSSFNAPDFARRSGSRV